MPFVVFPKLRREKAKPMALETMSRHGLMSGVVLGVASCCATLALCSRPAEAANVVELFTSQGCSACPPADKVLEKLSSDPNTIALSFSVDYWDYLGWRDTNAKPEFTHRQREYARARSDHAVFTPQAVLNGRTAVIGSREGEIRSTLDLMDMNGEQPEVAVSAHVDGSQIIIDLPAGAEQHEASVWIASYLPPKTVNITSGENRDTSVTYANVVDRLQVVGMWTGAAATIKLPLADVAPDGSAGLAVIVQSKDDGQLGPILGATRLTLQSGS